MAQELSSSALRVQQALNELGLELEVVELPDSTRTAVEAAEAVNSDLGQIVKSLVFRTKRSRQPVLVLVSGKNRVNERAIEELIDEPLGKADAEFVRQATGFAIGGVPPVGHNQEMRTFIDTDLLEYDYVWAAAGTPRAVFQVDPAELPRMTGGKVVDIH